MLTPSAEGAQGGQEDDGVRWEKNGTSILSITTAIRCIFFHPFSERRRLERIEGGGRGRFFVCGKSYERAHGLDIWEGEGRNRADCRRTIDTDEREAGPEYTMTV